LALILVSLLLLAVAAAQPAGAQGGAPASRPSRLLDDSGSRILDTTPQVIQPRWQSGGIPLSALPAAAQVLEARARLVPVAGANWFAVRYLREPNRLPPPQLLLPCQLLEQVEGFAQASPPPILKVSGETTWYHRRSFLFLREVIVEETPAAPDANRTPEASAAPRAGVDTRPVLLTELAVGPAASEANGPGSRPASAPATATSTSAPGGVDPDEILRRLMSQRPGKTIVTTAPIAQVEPNIASVAPPPAQGAIASAKGSLIVDRVVRIYAEDKGGWWIVSFVGDNTLREPPIRILPSPLLERAEKDAAAAAAKIKFRVTGDMTEYKGRRYLLLRKLMVEPDLGQL
jgi:hypothetical protein